MPQTSVKATISCGDRTITIEGPQAFVSEELAKISKVAMPDNGQGTAITGSGSPGLTPETASERQLIEAKRPRNHPETVAVLAFCLAQGGVEEFTEEDIRRAYLRAGVRPPKVVGQAIRDAKNNCDLIEPGSARGTYRLTHHGDRTVRFDLPAGE